MAWSFDSYDVHFRRALREKEEDNTGGAREKIEDKLTTLNYFWNFKC